MLAFTACSMDPRPPKDPVALEKLALEIRDVVEPGFTLRKEKIPASMWSRLREQGGYGAAVNPDSNAVMIGIAGFPRNYVYYYRLGEVTPEWERKVRIQGLIEVGDRWYWYQCPMSRFNLYPC